MGLDSFTLTNVSFSNGKLTATANYSITLSQLDTLSAVKIRVFYYDNSTTRSFDQPLSNTVGTFPITIFATGAPYVSISAQELAGVSTLSGNVIQAGTYYPVVMAPSPPSLSTGTYNPPNADGTNFYITTITSVGTANITINVKKPGDSAFSFFTSGPPTPNGIVPVKLPLSNGTYGTYSFQAQAFDSSNNGSQLSNIATITINSPAPSVATLTTALQAAIQYQIGRADLTNAFPGTYTGNYAALVNWASLYSAGTPIAQYLSSYQYMEANPSSVPAVTPPVLCIAVTVKAVDGTQQTFYLSQADSTGVSVSPPAAIISSIPSNNPISNTLQDVANFFQAHNHSITPPPQPTPPPTNVLATVTGQDIALTWVSQYPISLTMDGVLVVSNYSATAYTRFGTSIGTHNFTIFATNSGVNSTTVQVTATVSSPPPPQTNYSYNIQIPNVANALQLITATKYGTTQNISFPARAFVKNILNQDVSTIPNTLNAIYITQVGTTPNEIQVANALVGYFPVTPPPTGPKRSVLEIAGGIFAGLITLSLFSGGSSKKGKR